MTRICTIPEKNPDSDKSRMRDIRRYLFKKAEQCHILKNVRNKTGQGIFYMHLPQDREGGKYAKIKEGNIQSFKVSFDTPENLSIKAQHQWNKHNKKELAIFYHADKRNEDKITIDIAHL